MIYQKLSIDTLTCGDARRCALADRHTDSGSRDDVLWIGRRRNHVGHVGRHVDADVVRVRHTGRRRKTPLVAVEVLRREHVSQPAHSGAVQLNVSLGVAPLNIRSGVAEQFHAGLLVDLRSTQQR